MALWRMACIASKTQVPRQRYPNRDVLNECVRLCWMNECVDVNFLCFLDYAHGRCINRIASKSDGSYFHASNHRSVVKISMKLSQWSCVERPPFRIGFWNESFVEQMSIKNHRWWYRFIYIYWISHTRGNQINGPMSRLSCETIETFKVSTIQPNNLKVFASSIS